MSDAAAFDHTPWRRARLLPVGFAALVALVELLSLAGLYCPDTSSYLLQTLHGPYQLTFPLCPPLFPLVLDLVAFLSEPAWRMALLVSLQQLGFVATVWLVLRTGERLGRPRLAQVAAWLTAFYLPLSLMAQTALSDSVFVLLEMAACAAWISARSAGGALGAGALAGLAMAQRTVGVALVPVVVTAELLGRGPRPVRLLLWLAGFAAVIAGFVRLNQRRCGDAVLVHGTGIHLFCRVSAIDRELADTPEARRLQDAATRQGRDWRMTEQGGWHMHQVLTQDGLSRPEADQLLETIARQTLRADPLRTARNTLHSMVRTLRGEDVMGYLTFGGLRQPQYEHAVEVSLATWGTDRRLPEMLMRLLPPYPPPMWLSHRPIKLLEWWSRVARAWMGAWLLPVMLLLAVAAVLTRDRALMLLTALPPVQLAAAAFGDIPWAGNFDPCVPVLFLGALLVPAHTKK